MKPKTPVPEGPDAWLDEIVAAYRDAALSSYVATSDLDNGYSTRRKSLSRFATSRATSGSA